MPDEKTKRIAALLVVYEADEPHAEEEGYFPEYSDANAVWGELEEFVKLPHHGDCVNQASACMRCFAEHIIHKARWIAERIDG